MDLKSFVDTLFSALYASGLIRDVVLQTESSVVSGRAYLHGSDERFLRFFFNQATGTIAFALIVAERRLWGVDRDNRRGWHLHPLGNPNAHITIEPLSIPAIVRMLQDLIETDNQRKGGTGN